jgi:hypothetical protein
MLKLLRAAVVLTTAACVWVGISAVPAQASGPAIQVPFAADSGDACKYGVTKGVFVWTSGPLDPIARPGRIVKASGVLVDEPKQPDPKACPGDFRYTIGIYTAYGRTTELGREKFAVDNGELQLRFVFDATKAAEPVDVIVVQVCRISLLPGPFDYCGEPQKFRPGFPGPV